MGDYAFLSEDISNPTLLTNNLALYAEGKVKVGIYNNTTITFLKFASRDSGSVIHIVGGSNYSITSADATTGLYYYPVPPSSMQVNYSQLLFDLTLFNTQADVLAAMNDGIWTDIVLYPITYSSFNSTISGPAEAAVGDTVTVSAIPNAGYGITDASTQILVTNNDVAVPYTWDATNNRITFTMPDPS